MIEEDGGGTMPFGSYTKTEQQDSGYHSSNRHAEKEVSIIGNYSVMIISNPLHIKTTPAACSGTGSSVKRSENWSRPIPSIGCGRQTTVNWKVLIG